MTENSPETCPLSLTEAYVVCRISQRGCNLTLMLIRVLTGVGLRHVTELVDSAKKTTVLCYTAVISFTLCGLTFCLEDFSVSTQKNYMHYRLFLNVFNVCMKHVFLIHACFLYFLETCKIKPVRLRHLSLLPYSLYCSHEFQRFSGGFLSFLHINNFVNTLLQLNSINNRNGTVLQIIDVNKWRCKCFYYVFRDFYST